MKSMLLLMVAIGIALPASAWAVGVYRWTDASGQVHYSDQPIASAQRVNAALLKSREIRALPISSVPERFRTTVRRQCDAAKDRVSMYERAVVVYDQTATGVTYSLTPDQRRKRLAEFRAQRDRYCSRGATEALWRERLEQAEAEAEEPEGASIRIRGSLISRN